MNTVFELNNAFKRSQIEITSDTPYGLLRDYLKPYQKEKLPESITFKVAAGKKNYDLIRLFQSGQYFFSQKFIDVLSQFMDMSDKCYPIKVEGTEEQYYVIHNLEKFSYLNFQKSSLTFDKEPCFYREKEITPPIFTTPKSLYHFVVTEELKNALIKYKISNVEFDEAFLCTREEYKEWQDSRRLAKCRGKQ